MTNIVSFNKARHEKPIATSPPSHVDTRKTGVSGPVMEARLARLEGELTEARAELTAIHAHLSRLRAAHAKLDSRLSAMPTTWKLAALIFAGVALTLLALRLGFAHAG